MATNGASSASDIGVGSSSAPVTASATSDPGTASSAAPPPVSDTSVPVSSSSTTTTSSSTTPSTSSTTTSSTSSTDTSTSALPPTTTSAPVTTTPTETVAVTTSTGAGGSIVTLTSTRAVTQSAPTASTSAAVRSSSNGFLQNKAAMGAVFAIVGLVAAGLLFALVTNAIRRRRAKRFDREIAEEAERAPAPVFVDDDEDYRGDYHSDPYAGPGAYADHGDHYSGPTAYSDPTHTDGGYPTSDALSSGLHSNPGGGGTPSNYMYPSGYSDLGFSDVSSHGTFAQPPMEGQYNPGSYAAYGGAGVGAPGAYEMMGYHGQAQQGQQGEWGQQQPQQEWVAQGYTYPGEEHGAGPGASYPPTATTAHSSGSDVLARSKSGARSLVDAYAPGAAPPPAEVAQPKQYADGYVSHYQPRVEDGADAYGGLESMHGHVGGMDDGDVSDGEGDGRRVLKVANE
ncbi:hypothetical protein FB451DRAFT_626046 [Mycena latifolia]|nr:hypothetical protein FB451DRAFT_626046 [Mycena latifolia]